MMDIKAHVREMEPTALVLLAFAALLGALILLEIAGFFVTGAEAERIVARTTGSALAGLEAAPLGEAKSLMEGLKKNNLFSPSAPRQHPVTEVAGILGSEALINGRWYKTGDRVGEARIVAIEPTKVRIMWDGQEKEFLPITASGSGGSERPGPAGGRGSPARLPGGSRRGMAASAAGPPGPSTPPTIEGRGQLPEGWSSMSPEERQKYRQEMRQQLSRREQ